MITILAIVSIIYFCVIGCGEITRFMYIRKWLKEYDPIHPLIREHYKQIVDNYMGGKE